MNDYPIELEYLNQVRDLFGRENHPVLTMLENLHHYTFEALVKAYDWYTFAKWQRVAVRMDRMSQIDKRIDDVVRAANKQLKTEEHDELEKAWNKVKFDRRDEDRRIAFLIAAQRAKVASLSGSFDLFKALKQGDSDLSALESALKKEQEPTDFPPEAWKQVAILFDRLKKNTQQECLVDDALAVLLALLTFYLKEDDLANLAEQCLPEDRVERALNTGNELALLAGEEEDKLLKGDASWHCDLDGYKKLANGAWGIQKSPYLLARLALASRLMELCHDELRQTIVVPQRASPLPSAVRIPEGVKTSTDFPNWLFHFLWRSKEVSEVRSKQQKVRDASENLNPFLWKKSQSEVRLLTAPAPPE